MLVAATVCPHPPLLVPAVSVAEPAWLADLRRACRAGVAAMLEQRPDRVVVVGAGPETRRFGATTGGTLRQFGVDARAGGHDLALTPAATIGAWLLDDAGWTGQREYCVVSQSAVVADCARLGEEVAADGRVGLLVMGDGSAKRSTEAPGYLDGRAAGFDTEVVKALATADAATLLGLDPTLADELWVAGRPAWQVLAGAMAAGGRRFAAEVTYDGAPRGVGYVVATLRV